MVAKMAICWFLKRALESFSGATEPEALCEDQSLMETIWFISVLETDMSTPSVLQVVG